MKFSELVKNLPEDKPIFVGEEKIYNSTVNDVLARHCKECGISVISIHGLRHTHASLLLFAGVSIASVARRLGHASMTTTQKTYLHIIQELENKDVDLVMRTLSGCLFQCEGLCGQRCGKCDDFYRRTGAEGGEFPESFY